MADLLTHVGTAFLAKAATRRAGTGVFVVGVTLPDLAARVPGMALQELGERGLAIPEPLYHASTVFHQPVGMVLLVLLIASFFVGPQQRLVFWNLLGGCLLHLAIDLLQGHVGGGHMLFFPLSTQDYELGWMGTEASVMVAPVLLAAGYGIWRWRHQPRSVAPTA